MERRSNGGSGGHSGGGGAARAGAALPAAGRHRALAAPPHAAAQRGFLSNAAVALSALEPGAAAGAGEIFLSPRRFLVLRVAATILVGAHGRHRGLCRRLHGPSIVRRANGALRGALPPAPFPPTQPLATQRWRWRRRARSSSAQKQQKQQQQQQQQQQQRWRRRQAASLSAASSLLAASSSADAPRLTKLARVLSSGR